MTTIGRSVIIEGKITSDDDLTVEGTVRGEIHLPKDATLVIGDRARVQADVRGARITVLGHLRGSINATERIELRSTATVEGSLSATRIVIAEGATFQGSIDMGQRTIAAKVAQFKAAQPSG